MVVRPWSAARRRVARGARIAVERRGRLVEKDNAGVPDHRASDGEALALAPGEEARRRPGSCRSPSSPDEIMRHGVPRGLLDLGIRRLGPA